ncbi:tetratricopeptide repeat protein [Ottowia thiooxydans]|uniref:type III secretion apparatus assembly chaperone SctY n=1 Tax=Ottowia thiooxydans TaxID=219182 RepID=UPI00040BD861|nr:hypothetical protein [Ottowia thiooxydans]
MKPDAVPPLPDFGRADGISSTQIELMDLLSYIYLRHGLPDKAAVLLAARDLLAPDNRITLLTLALAQVRASKPERALETLERLAMLGAVDAPFHLVRAQAFQALGRIGEAAGAMRAHVALRASQKNDVMTTVN